MSSIKLSERARSTPASPIRQLAPYAREAAAAGRKVYYLNIGQPDVRTPKEFFDGLARFKDDVVAYEISEGYAPLREAWSAYMEKTADLKVPPENMLITTGASEALIFTFMTCCDPGDEVLIFDPTYANYIGFAAISGINLVPVLTTLETDFCLPPTSEIESKIGPKTKAILLCNPNNPTGTVYRKEEVARILALCNKHNLFLIVDETYREIVYDGRKPTSVYHLDDDNDRVIVVDSLSKRFSLCGARLGCMFTTNQEVLAKSLNQAQARLASPTIAQFAAAHMLEHIEDEYLKMVKAEYQSRRDLLYASLSRIEGVSVVKPDGAFYSVAELPVDDTEKFASFILRDFHYRDSTVFVAPAGGFYMEEGRGRTKIRIASVLNTEDLGKAVEVLKHGLEAYNTL